MAMQSAKKNQSYEESNMIKFENEGDSIEGFYIGSSQFRSKKGDDITKHKFRQRDGSLDECFGATSLNDLENVTPGAYTRVVFLGYKTSKKGREFKDFTIEFDDQDLIPVAEGSAKGVTQPPKSAKEALAAARVKG